MTLQQKLSAIKNVFDVDSILRLDTSPKEIAKYYNLNRLAYWLFVSRDGFVHMGLSEDGFLLPEDFKKTAVQISKLIAHKEAKEVLELATGKGGNLRYLASQHPNTRFYGLDLPGGQTDEGRFREYPNIEYSQGDYHDLSEYPSSTMDIVFVVEALCHAQPKQNVIQEVYRVLRPGGSFIVYDGYNLKPYKEMEPEEVLAVKLGWKGMLVNPDDMYIADFQKLVIDAGFEVEVTEDLGQSVLPTLKSLEKPASRFFKHPKLARLIKGLLPTYFVVNAISGYVMPDVVENNLCTYSLTIAKK
jgi:SAM-dependent methyltransferase